MTTTPSSPLTAAIQSRTDDTTVVRVHDKDKLVGDVTFTETTTTIVLQKAYTNWSRQVVRLAKETLEQTSSANSQES